PSASGSVDWRPSDSSRGALRDLRQLLDGGHRFGAGDGPRELKGSVVGRGEDAGGHGGGRRGIRQVPGGYVREARPSFAPFRGGARMIGRQQYEDAADRLREVGSAHGRVGLERVVG